MSTFFDFPSKTSNSHCLNLFGNKVYAWSGSLISLVIFYKTGAGDFYVGGVLVHWYLFTMWSAVWSFWVLAFVLLVLVLYSLSLGEFVLFVKLVDKCVLSNWSFSNDCYNEISLLEYSILLLKNDILWLSLRLWLMYSLLDFPVLGLELLMLFLW